MKHSTRNLNAILRLNNLKTILGPNGFSRNDYVYWIPAYIVLVPGGRFLSVLSVIPYLSLVVKRRRNCYLRRRSHRIPTLRRVTYLNVRSLRPTVAGIVLVIVLRRDYPIETNRAAKLRKRERLTCEMNRRPIKQNLGTFGYICSCSAESEVASRDERELISRPKSDLRWIHCNSLRGKRMKMPRKQK
jgi:hypothetical protein